tara:strand:- start:147 stop:572 length:426 start_codon:yes stop_codon:yes gene_type:complete
VKHKTIKSQIEGVTLHELPLFSDCRGFLTVGEFEREIPFPVKRYFVIFGVPQDKIRGNHAHKYCHEFLVCLKGSFYISVDDGKKIEEYKLDSSNKGIYIPPKIWTKQYKYSPDSVLIVFASHYYDQEGYITDYKAFKKIKG